MSAQAGWFPWHFVMLTPSGHALHFSAELPHEQNHLAPWWFLGRVRGIRRSQLCKALRDSGRDLRWRLRRPWMIHVLLACVTIVCLVPWLFAWFLWPAAWMIAGARHALVRRQVALNRSGTFSALQAGPTSPKSARPAAATSRPAGDYLAIPAHLADDHFVAREAPAWRVESA